MRTPFFGATYLTLGASVVMVLFALIAATTTTYIVLPQYERFGQVAYGLDPAIKVVEVTEQDLARVWRPVAARGTEVDLPVLPDVDDLYPPRYLGAPLPENSARANDLTLNLFYALMYYGHPPEEYDGQVLTHEYDRASGYGRVVHDVAEEIYMDVLSYQAALELHHRLYPENALFEEERLRMRGLTSRLLPTLPQPEAILSSPRAMNDQPYFLARELADLTGEAWFDEFAEGFAAASVRQGVYYADIVAAGLPHTVYPTHFYLPPVMHDMATRSGNPELRRKAVELMHYLIDQLYDPMTGTIYNDYGSIGGPGSDTRQAVDQIAAMQGLGRYVELTGDATSERLFNTLSSSYLPSAERPSVFLNPQLDIYKIWAKQNEQGTLTQGDRVAAILNLGALEAVQRFNESTNFATSADQEFAFLLEAFKQKLYDENFNGFYFDYQHDPASGTWEPVGRNEHFYLVTRIPARLVYLILADQNARAEAIQQGLAPASAATTIDADPSAVGN